MGDDVLPFVLKNLRADELRLITGPFMRTLGDLRDAANRRWLVPNHLQNFVSGGRNSRGRPDSYLIKDLLAGTSEGPNQERYIWITWMADQDYIDVGDSHMGMFLETELDVKRAKAESRGQRLEYVSLSVYRSMSSRILLSFKEYTDANRELGTDVHSEAE